jgi:hypothetical protein
MVPVGNTISRHLSSGPTSTQIDASGPHKVWGIGKFVEKFRNKIGKILSSSSYVSVARATTIDILPDDVLLQIFDFCGVVGHPLEFLSHPVLEWHRLIHVCRRWRQIIFSSPHRLDLYLLCKQGTPVRKNLGIWPAFPIIIHYDYYPFPTPEISSNDEDNIIAALEHPGRVRCLKLRVTSSLMERVATVAPESFPMLTQLWLSSEDGSVLIAPSAFLGRSAPRLQEIHLEGVFFPTLPAFLSSASDLVVLYLHDIPHTEYTSAEAMVASLAALPRLHDLSIEFRWSPSLPHQSGSSRTCAAPPTHVVLPVLNFFGFQGTSDYLEDLVGQIDTPRLASIRIKYFDQLVFQVPQLFRLTSQIQIIEQASMMNAEVHFYHSYVQISLFSGIGRNREDFLDLEIMSRGLDSQVSHLTEVLSQSSMVLSNVHHLFILMDSTQPGRDNVDNIEWLALLRRFTAVQTLLISCGIAWPIADALNDVTAAMAPEILPALRSLQLIGEGAGCVKEFITARQLSGLPPVTVR